MKKRIKKIVSVILAALNIVAVSAIHISAADTENIPAINIPAVLAYSGESVDIPLTVSGLSNCSGYEIYLTLPEVLVLSGVKQNGTEMADVSENGKSSLLYGSYKNNGKTVLKLFDTSDNCDAITFSISAVPQISAIGEYSFGLKAYFFDKNDNSSEYTVSLGALSIEHKEAEAWSYNAEYHWKLCNVEGCKIHTENNSISKSAHSYGNGTIKSNESGKYCTVYSCTVCGYTYSTEYTDAAITDGAEPEASPQNSLIYGKAPAACEIYDNSSIYSLLTGPINKPTDCDYSNFDMVSGEKGLYFDNTGKQRNQNSSQVYTDILYELSGNNESASISSVWIKHASGLLSTYSYEIYVSASRVGISDKKNLVASVINSGAAEQQAIKFSSVKGRWILIRITMGVQPNAVSQYSYKSTHARIQEISVFGKNIPIASGITDNAVSPHQLTDSLIYQNPQTSPSVNPLKADIVDSGSKYSIKSGNVRALHNGDDTAHINIVYNNTYGKFKDSSGYRNIHTDTDIYVDIIYLIPADYYDYIINEIYVKLSAETGNGLNAYKYEIFISDSLSNIDDISNMAAAVTNTNDASSQLITLGGNKKGTYMLWRIIAGTHNSFSSGSDLSYARLSEIAIFGEKDSNAYDINSDGAIDIRDLVREKKIIAGISSPTRASDFDGDGTVGASDLIEIKQWLLKSQLSAACSSYKAISSNSSYQNPIASSGKEASGSERSITVDLNNTVFENYMGLGTNIFAATLSDEGRDYTGYNEVLFDLDKKRINTLAPTTARFLFPVDWMITDTEKNPRRSDWKNNKDYINYKNGIYDFESSEMESAIKYLEALKEAGTKVELNFGWKVSSRITTWFSAPNAYYGIAAAPRDINAYSAACSALMNYLINEKGFDNIKYLSFYNEPNGYYEFTIDDQKIPYYASIIKQTSEKLASYNRQNKIDIWGAETGGALENVVSSWINGLNSVAQTEISGYSIHSYYTPDYKPAAIDYSHFFKTYSGIYGALKKSGLQNKRIMITEYLPSTASEGQQQWNYTDAAQLIATANTGMLGLMNWDMFGGYVTQPITGGYFRGSKCWETITGKAKLSQVKSFFNEASVFCNYIGSNADVLFVDWSGTDIRTAAFRREDGEYTFIIEANDGNERELTVKLSKSLGKDIYRYVYIPDEALTDENALIPSADKIISDVGNKITDTIAAKYAVYVYTTAKPRTQLKLERVWNSCEAGGAVNLKTEIIDGSEAETAYTILSYTGTAPGKISNNGTYYADSDSKPGSLISVKVYLKNNPEIYTVAIIEIS